jgi:hypothetical protein
MEKILTRQAAERQYRTPFIEQPPNSFEGMSEFVEGISLADIVSICRRRGALRRRATIEFSPAFQGWEGIADLSRSSRSDG